jgi:O-antigen ligase
MLALIALGPALSGLRALSLPDLVAANAVWVNLPLMVTLPAIWLTALAAGLRASGLIAGLSRTDLSALGLLLLIAGGTGALAAPVPAFSFMFLAMTLAVGLTGLALRALLDMEPALAWPLLLSLVLAVLLHLPLVLWFMAHQADYGLPELIRAIPGFKNVRRWGFLLAGAVALGLALAGPGRARWPLAGLVALLACALGWSGTRGGILALGAALALSGLLAPAAFRRFALPGVLALVLGLGASLLLPSPGRDFGLIPAVERSLDAAPLPPGQARAELWRSTLARIAERPVFGHGYAQNIWVTRNPVVHTQVHNVVLEILLAFGLIGGLPAFWLGLKLGLSACLRLRAMPGPLTLAGFLGLATMAAFGLVDGTLFYPEPLFLAAASAALLFSRASGPPDR